MIVPGTEALFDADAQDEEVSECVGTPEAEGLRLEDGQLEGVMAPLREPNAADAVEREDAERGGEALSEGVGDKLALTRGEELLLGEEEGDLLGPPPPPGVALLHCEAEDEAAPLLGVTDGEVLSEGCKLVLGLAEGQLVLLDVGQLLPLARAERETLAHPLARALSVLLCETLGHCEEEGVAAA